MITLAEHVSLAPYTTLGIGGPARYFTEVHSVTELIAAIAFAEERQLPCRLLGGGSNVLISDEGYPGLIIRMSIMGRSYHDEGESVVLTCGAGEFLDTVIAETVSLGYSGLENLSAIPGTMGATPVQNVGAYGVEIGELVTTVAIYDSKEKVTRVLSQHECQFSYRDSLFKQVAGTSFMVTHVSLRLQKKFTPRLEYFSDQKQFDTPLTAQVVRSTIMHIRASKFPDWRVLGTAGSFFKNPVVSEAEAVRLQMAFPDLPLYKQTTGVKVSLGYVLDKICALRGVWFGPVGLYEGQALVLVVKPHTTAYAVEEVVKKISEIVFNKTGLTIEREVQQI